MTNKMENKNDVTMEKNYTVYMHVSPNGKVYIGITSLKPKYRWENGRGYKGNEYFYRAIKKYEWNNFEHIIIENNLTKEQAENMEIELIAKYRSNDREYGYNIESGGNCKGKASDETRKKMSDNNKGGNNPHAKKVYCDGMIFECILECANYYNVNRDTMQNWLLGRNKMPLNFQKLNLRYVTENDLNECEKYDINKHGDNININFNINNGNFVHCDNLIFKSVKNCANYYGLNKGTMHAWLKGRNKMPLNFQKLNLRYATNEDLNTYPRYTLENN